MQNTAYGASFAGGAFDLASFFKQPQTILRIISWIFSIVVFATITAEGYINTQTESESKCMYNQNDSACSYAVGIGVLAFVACVIFLLLDAYFPQMSNAKDRRYIVFGDLGFSGLWTLLWFICFCVLASQWHQTETTAVPADAARAGIAFSFFSILSWGLLSYFAFVKYKQGVTDLNQAYTDPANDHTSPYPPSGGVPAGYQQSPFSSQGPGAGEYQPPTY
ncbi:synaptogyrin-2a [Boleophthalmus pectinirostris]|uniref:synaptogyrin-2a n=1 Tax=Boleophthalmus pectinirostris TaxID=150288 RepID=UPI000A1C1CB4|nr:synaptogyrin-2a [Boleophthalmus pectinirostris]